MILCALPAALALLTMAPSSPAPWDMKRLSVAPQMVSFPSRDEGDVRAIFYDGLPWKGKPTRVFAYVGLPKLEPGKKAPAMVLVHGGGGSAFVPWVKLWQSRGYAAIAMDTCGSISGGGYQNHPRHEDGGPPGWGGFELANEPPQDQWPYHAVADVVLAHSLIRSLPEVDANRTGITGISWGGYLTCIVAGVDPRFKLAVPVYGCGFLGENSAWLKNFDSIGKETANMWLGLWDPSVYLANAKMPFLWVTGTNDFAYPMDSLQLSYRLPRGPKTLCIRVRMPHGHGGAGENPAEIGAFADSLLKQGAPLTRIKKTTRTGSDVVLSYSGRQLITRAELVFTREGGKWLDRKWETIPVTLDSQNNRVEAKIPSGAVVYYLNLIDQKDNVVSSEHEELVKDRVKVGN